MSLDPRAGKRETSPTSKMRGEVGDISLTVPLRSLATWTHKLGSKEFVAAELDRAFQVS